MMYSGNRRPVYYINHDDLPAGFMDVAVDWKETREAHLFVAEVPGLKKEDLKVEIQGGNVLQISGEKKKADSTERWHRVERKSGKFVKRLKLPANAKVDELKAAMANGVLTLTVPKLPKVWSVDIDIRT